MPNPLIVQPAGPNQDWTSYLLNNILGTQPGHYPGQGPIENLTSGNPLYMAWAPIQAVGDALSVIPRNTTGRILGGMAGDWTNPDAWYNSELSNSLPGVAINILTDPTTYATMGAGPASKLASLAGKYAPALAPAAEALVRANQVTDAAVAPVAKAVASGIGSAAGAVNSLSRKVMPGGRGLLDLSHASEADKIANAYNSAVVQLRSNGFRGDLVPTDELLNYVSPGSSSATRQVMQGWDALEQGLMNEQDPIKQVYGTLMVNHARSMASRDRRAYATSLQKMMADAVANGMDPNEARSLAGEAWYSSTRLKQDAATKALAEYTPPTGYTVTPDVRQAMNQDLALFHTAAADARQVAEQEVRKIQLDALNRAGIVVDPTQPGAINNGVNQLLVTNPAAKAAMDTAVDAVYHTRDDKVFQAGKLLEQSLETNILGGSPSRSRDLANTFSSPTRPVLAADELQGVLRGMGVPESYLQTAGRGQLLQWLENAPDARLTSEARAYLNNMGAVPSGIPSSTLLNPLESEQARNLQNMVRNLERQSYGLRQAMGTLPSDLVDSFDRFAPLAEDLVRQAKADKLRVIKALQGITNIPNTIRTEGDLLRFLESIGAARPGAGLEGGTLLNGLAGRTDLMNPNDYQAMQNAIGRWQGRGDLMTDDPLLLIEDKFRTAVRGLLEAEGQALPEGGRQSSRFGDALRTANLIWKENVLAHPATLLTNMGSGMLFNLMGGHPNLGRTLSNFRQVAHNMVDNPHNPGLHWYSPDVQGLLGDIGWNDLPQSLGASFINSALENVAGLSKSATSKIPLWGRMAGGAALGAGAGPVGAVAGAVHGAVAPMMVDSFKLLGRAWESSVRSTIWHDVMNEGLASNAGTFADDVTAKLTPLIQTVSGQGISTDPAAVEKVVEWIRSTGGRFSLKDLDAQLFSATDGQHVEEINSLVRDWAERQNAVSRAGIAESNRIHFDYQHMNNLEEFLKQFVPFHKWATSAIPFYTERIAEHPAILAALNQYEQTSQRQQDQGGLASRFTNAVAEGTLPGDWLARLVLGRPGSTFVNPSNLLFPMANLGPAAERSSHDDSAVGKIFDIMSGLGLAPGPAVTIPATLAGILGKDQQLPNLNRLSPMYAAVPGTLGDPEAGWKGVLNSLVNRQPFDADAYATRKRMAEQSVEQTGKPITANPDMMAAMLNPLSPGYQEAQKAAEQTRALQAFAGMVAPLGWQFLPDSERAISLERKAYPQGPIDTEAERQALAQAITDHPLGSAYQTAQGSPQQNALTLAREVLHDPAILFPEAPPAFRQHLQALWTLYKDQPPQVQAWMRKEQPVLGMMSQRMSAYTQGNPLLQAYLGWAAANPMPRQEGDPSRDQQFFDWYSRMPH